MSYIILDDKTKEISVDKTISLIRTAVAILDGWINPTNKVSSVTISDEYGPEKICQAGTASWTSIAINVKAYQVYTTSLVKHVLYTKSLNVVDKNLATLMIYNVAHELSHLQQNVGKYYSLNNNGFLATASEKLEVSNELRTCRFLHSHYEEICNVLGFYMDPMLFFITATYLNKMNKKGNKRFYSIHKFSDVSDNIVKLISGFSKEEIDRCIKDKGVKNEVNVWIKKPGSNTKYNAYRPYNKPELVGLEEAIVGTHKVYKSDVGCHKDYGFVIKLEDTGETIDDYDFRVVWNSVKE